VTTVPTPDAPVDPMLDKIRKVLAKAEDPACTPQEAELFTAKATELIAKYGIDRAMLAATDKTSDRPGDRIIVVDAPFALDKVDLLVAIAEPLRCANVTRTRYPDGAKQLSVHLFGYQSDLERVELLYTSLLVQSANALAATRAPWGESVAAWKRSFLAGFSAAIYRRLKDAEQRAQAQAETTCAAGGKQGGPSVALVLVDRQAVVEKAKADAYPKLKNAAPRRLSGDGIDAGYRAGQRANLGGTGVGAAASRQVGAR
jgi:hypothetical protein